MSVDIILESKRYNCSITLYEKLTYIHGNSGQGKTEFTRRMESRSKANRVSISNGFDYRILTSSIFKDICDIAIKRGTPNKKREKILSSYWSTQENFPYSNMILIIDDEDFVKSEDFATFYNCDKSNYYIIINRANLPKISYSVGEIYDFIADGKDHYLRKTFKFNETTNDCISTVVVEGKGSDFIFFNKLFRSEVKVLNPTSLGDLLNGGRASVVKMIENNRHLFQGEDVFFLIDFCAFGGNIDDLYNICQQNNIGVSICKDYLSFEYLLLKSNFICDTRLDDVIEKDRLKFLSLEVLFTSRLEELTKGTYYSYSKSSKDFKPCYFDNCCLNKDYRGNCDIRTSKLGKNKLYEMLIGTEFEWLLSYLSITQR